MKSDLHCLLADIFSCYVGYLLTEIMNTSLKLREAQWAFIDQDSEAFQ